MFKLLAIILTALVAAFVPVNAWTIQLFEDGACSNLPSILTEITTGEQACASVGTQAASLIFVPDEGIEVQVFSDDDCLTTPSLVLGTGCTLIGAFQSFSVINKNFKS